MGRRELLKMKQPYEQDKRPETVGEKIKRIAKKLQTPLGFPNDPNPNDQILPRKGDPEPKVESLNPPLEPVEPDEQGH